MTDRSTPFPERGSVRAARRLAVRLAVVAVCAISGACLRGQAKTLPEIPLDVPTPPPRSVEVIEPQETPIVPLPEEPTRNPPPPPALRPRPTPAPRADNRPAEPRQDPADVAKPTEDPVRNPPATTLQTAPAQQETEAERKVRAQLSQATTALNRINVQSLNTDARQQFDTARRFVLQAEDALRSRNLVFASNLAEKAVALAAQLSGR